jgi:hypothetical protein
MNRALLLLALAAPAAWACGVCIEDKVAATYDYVVLQRAASHGQVVVFCEIRGRVDAARIRQAITRMPAIDAASVRVSAEPAAVSFALDSARQSPKVAVAALQRVLPAGTRLAILRLGTVKGLETVAP